MAFTSLTFLALFLPVVLGIYFACRGIPHRNLALLMASLVFYAWGEPVYVVVMLGSIVVNWLAGLMCARWDARRKAIGRAAVAANLAVLGWFKYSAFVVDNVNHVFSTGFALPSRHLPIGLSFFTFGAISYVLDVSRRDVEPERSPLMFGTYLSMFPHLVAGPIVRYATIAGTLARRHTTVEDAAAGMRRVCTGLAKKVLIANTMGRIADAVIAAGPSLGAIPAWLGFVAYAFQIYFDFSSYSDMAIGLARILGFRFPENFDYPYVARSVGEFWRRWHISLSTFLRDYVFLPASYALSRRFDGERWLGARVDSWIYGGATLITMSLAGLWHGANWNFVAWGIYIGVLLVGERVLWGRALARGPRAVQRVYAMTSILFGWVVFRIEGLGDAMQWMVALFGGFGAGHIATLNALNVLHLLPWLVVAAFGCTPWPAAMARRIFTDGAARWALNAAALAAAAWATVATIADGYQPFIYFRF